MTVPLFFRRFWPSALVVLIILYATLSSDPTGDLELPLFPYFDKFIHALMFGGLTGAVAFDIQRSQATRVLTPMLMVRIALGVALFGVSDEIAQEFLTVARSGEWLDWCADLLGIFIAALTAPRAVYLVLHKK